MTTENPNKPIQFEDLGLELHVLAFSDFKFIIMDVVEINNDRHIVRYSFSGQNDIDSLISVLNKLSSSGTEESLKLAFQLDLLALTCSYI